jgi:thiamine-monophosphate kinase
MPETGENALVAWLRERFPPDPGRVPIGIGDDMAVLRFGTGLVAMTADMLLDGVHFDTHQHSYELIGRKAMACSLSDCAAMACDPVAATVSLALPNSIDMADVKRLYEGMAEVAGRFGCRIVGGDTTSWPGRLAIDVAMLAEPMSPRGPVRRCDARPGDAIFVSGPLGGSILGRHLTFAPRLELARLLAEDRKLHAMMDLSDGLSMDLCRMCAACRCRAELHADWLEQAISPAARELARTYGGTPVEHALNDGEDFELLIAGHVEMGELPCGLICIGLMMPLANATQSSLITLIHPDGRREPVEPRGYEHWK